MYWRLLALPIVFANLAWMSNAIAETMAIKASSPVSISISTVENNSSNSLVAFVVSATSTAAADNFVINVKLPGEAVVHDGQTQWQGAIAAGEVIELGFTAELRTDIDQHITASATISTPQGARLSASAIYESFAASVSAFKREKAHSRSRASIRKGRSVSEYSLK